VLESRRRLAANREESKRIAERNPLQLDVTPVLQHASPEPCPELAGSRRVSASRETPSMGPVKTTSAEGPVFARYLSFVSPCAEEDQVPRKPDEVVALPDITMSPIILTPAALL
jgi:hypothetical protein